MLAAACLLAGAAMPLYAQNPPAGEGMPVTAEPAQPAPTDAQSAAPAQETPAIPDAIPVPPQPVSKLQ